MGIFSLPAELTRCSDSLLWFAPPPWSPLRLTPCSSELATLALATLVLDTATLVPTAMASLLPASTPPTSPSLAGDFTKQTSIATFCVSFCALKEGHRLVSVLTQEKL